PSARSSAKTSMEGEPECTAAFVTASRVAASRPVEVVVVGDAPLDDELSGLLAATREAVTNAAVHSGSPSIDVFAELRADGSDVFVRDTGVGFDPTAVPEDRRGLADSIVGRLERAGGTAAVDTTPGGGTEVELHLPRS
ncbi:MAG: ATP-binding protein, partial [Actinomycetota bacterium]